MQGCLHKQYHNFQVCYNLILQNNKCDLDYGCQSYRDQHNMPTNLLEIEKIKINFQMEKQ